MSEQLTKEEVTLRLSAQQVSDLKRLLLKRCQVQSIDPTSGTSGDDLDYQRFYLNEDVGVAMQLATFASKYVALRAGAEKAKGSNKDGPTNIVRVETHRFISEAVGFLLEVGVAVPRQFIPLLQFLQSPQTGEKIAMSDIDSYGYQVSKGLEFIHEELDPALRVTHGAIRADNVFVDPLTGRCILGHFAWEVVPSKQTLERYAPWIAPELERPKAFAKYRRQGYEDSYIGQYRQPCDIFALGCTLIEMYTRDSLRIKPLRFAYRYSESQWDQVQGEYNSAFPENPDPGLIPARRWIGIRKMMYADPCCRPNAERAAAWMSDVNEPLIIHIQPVYGKNHLHKAMQSAKVK